MHLAARRVGTVNTRGRADVAGSGKKLFRQKGTGNARVGPSGPTSAKAAASPSRGAIETIATRCRKRPCERRSGWRFSPSFRTIRPSSLDGLSLAKPKTQEVAKIFRAIKRPDLSEAEAAESVGETKTTARGRTLERRTILFGLPGHDSGSSFERPQH